MFPRSYCIQACLEYKTIRVYLPISDACQIKLKFLVKMLHALKTDKNKDQTTIHSGGRLRIWNLGIQHFQRIILFHTTVRYVVPRTASRLYIIASNCHPICCQNSLPPARSEKRMQPRGKWEVELGWVGRRPRASGGWKSRLGRREEKRPFEPTRQNEIGKPIL